MHLFSYFDERVSAKFQPAPHPKKTCPVTHLSHSDDHMYMPHSASDRRSPCPALNTLANHGYLPRSGMDITPSALASALRAGFGLSAVLATFLAYVGFVIQFGAHPGDAWNVCLDDFARHGRIEHNASLAHDDAGEGMLYAPCSLDPKRMVGSLQGDDGEIGLDDIARARVRRERESGQLDVLHSTIACAEMALVLGLFGSPPPDGALAGKVSLNVLEKWWMEERFPEGWAPRKLGFLKTFRLTTGIAGEMKRLRAEES
ncbi:Chloroperoxidase [Amylostereum chailletii]|nr:Chloroperoxidase [Amylostereum chailletii]